MRRRDFFRKAIGVGLLAGSGLKLVGFNGLFNAQNNYNELVVDKYNLVAVMGGEPDFMFDKGIAELGGMQAFVKPGQKVLVKPNIGWDKKVDIAANTNPKLVKRIVEHCMMAGASEVFVFDHTCDKWLNCYKNSGIEEAVKLAGGKMVPADSETYYREVELPQGIKLKKVKVHEKVLDTDVFINVPVLKMHKSCRLSIAMKNMMGIVWNRYWWHGNDLHQCIADCSTRFKPHLNVVDAYRVMFQNGPRGIGPEDTVIKKSLILSTDIVAADAAAAKIFGIEPDDINYIKMAHQAGVGNKNLTELSIKRLKV